MSPGEHQLIFERTIRKDKTEVKGTCSLVNSDAEPATALMISPVPCSRFCWVRRTRNAYCLFKLWFPKGPLNEIRPVGHWCQTWVCGEGRIEFMLAKSPDATKWVPQPYPLPSPLVKLIFSSIIFKILLPLPLPLPLIQPHSKPVLPNQSS